jgi:hypothetical protein
MLKPWFSVRSRPRTTTLEVFTYRPSMIAVKISGGRKGGMEEPARLISSATAARSAGSVAGFTDRTNGA